MITAAPQDSNRWSDDTRPAVRCDLDRDPIRVRFTVVDPARSGARADVEVSAPPDLPFGQLRATLLTAVGSDPGQIAGFSVHGRAVSEDHLIGRPPLLDGSVLTVEPPQRPPSVPGAEPLPASEVGKLHVVAGPDPGHRIALRPPGCRIGRATGAQLRLCDPDLSRLHAEVEVCAQDGESRVRVRDLGSTNGTSLDGQAVGSTWVPVPDRAALRVGGSTLVLQPAPERGGPPSAAVHPDGRGHLLVNRTPQLTAPVEPAPVTFPPPPAPPPNPGLPWAAALLPLLVSVPVALVWRQTALLLLAALSPVAALGQYLTDRIGHRRRLTRLRQAYEQGVAAAEAAVRAALEVEAARRAAEHPDLAQVAATAAGPLSGLWRRQPEDADAYVVRLGRGRVPSRLDVRRPPGAEAPALELDDVPVTLDLARAPVLGIAGPRAEVLGLTRSIIGQLVIWHPPADLRLEIQAEPDDAATAERDWSWAGWLPHSADETLAGRRAQRGNPDPCSGPEVRRLIILDGAERLRRSAEVAEHLGGSAAGDRIFVCLDKELRRLPVECRATVSLTGGVATLRVRNEQARSFSAEFPGQRWATGLARDLAALRDSTPPTASRDLPGSVRLVDLLGSRGLDPCDPASIGDRWRGPPRPPAVALGMGRDGPWTVDLVRDGPHLLIGGTTGSGKSELLQALVAALAVEHPPERLAFLLIDYKGGAAFDRLTGLPHVGGVLTDLEGNLAERALVSLRAELTRRERLLRAVGVVDHAQFGAGARQSGAADQALPRLLILVDEFRVLADEVPGFVDGLVRIAAVGRSLGIHLVLATQRPGGAISADMRANLNLRVALRVRDRADSEDVLEVPDAALLPAAHPGRGLARAGGGGLIEFQAARVSGHAPSAHPLTVHRLGVDAARPGRLRPGAPVPVPGREWLPPGEPGRAEVGPEPSDLDRIVAAVRTAADRCGASKARSPWLPPLPARIRRADLAELGVPSGGESGVGSGGRGRDPVLRYAVADLPHLQRRELLGWNLGAGNHLAIVGGPGSGRTGVLAALARAAGSGPAAGLGSDGSEAGVVAPGMFPHVHAIDGRGELAWLEDLDQVGTVLPVGDLERAERLLGWLTGEVARRRRSRGGPASTDDPWLILLVDGWEEVLQHWGALDGDQVEALLRLARDGPPARLRLAVTGGRGLLAGSWGALFGERLLLRSHDPTDLLLAGVPASRLPAEMPPGRALLMQGTKIVEAQVLLEPREPTDGAGRHLSRAASQGRGEPAVYTIIGAERQQNPASPGIGPLRLAALPDRVPLAGNLPAGTAEAPVIGLTAADPQQAAMTSPATGPTEAGLAAAVLRLPFPGTLVLGAPGSGRSTALHVIGRAQLLAGRRVIVLATTASPLALLAAADDRIARLPAIPEPAALSAALARTGPEVTVLVDDVQQLDGAAAEGLLVDLLQSGRRGGVGQGIGPRILLGSGTAEAALSFRGLLAAVRAARTGLILGATTPADGEVFGMRLPSRPPGPPGRGLLVQCGQVRTVQVVDPTGEPAR